MMTKQDTPDASNYPKCGHCGALIKSMSERCSNGGYCSPEGQPVPRSAEGCPGTWVGKPCVRERGHGGECQNADDLATASAQTVTQPIRHTVAGILSVTIPADRYDALIQAIGTTKLPEREPAPWNDPRRFWCDECASARGVDRAVEAAYEMGRRSASACHRCGATAETVFAEHMKRVHGVTYLPDEATAERDTGSAQTVARIFDEIGLAIAGIEARGDSVEPERDCLRVVAKLREKWLAASPCASPARLDADKSAKPLTELVGVFPQGKAEPIAMSVRKTSGTVGEVTAPRPRESGQTTATNTTPARGPEEAGTISTPSSSPDHERARLILHRLAVVYPDAARRRDAESQIASILADVRLETVESCAVWLERRADARTSEYGRPLLDAALSMREADSLTKGPAT